MEKKHNGAHNELIASCWLLRRGYEVFRNVSPHGAVDIIAMKNGEITLFDVKKASLLVSGEPIDLKLRADQIALGVKLLIVFGEDNECRINEDPKTAYSRKGNCIECGKEFVAMKHTQVACSNDCRRKIDNRKLYILRHGEQRLREFEATKAGR